MTETANLFLQCIQVIATCAFFFVIGLNWEMIIDYLYPPQERKSIDLDEETKNKLKEEFARED